MPKGNATKEYMESLQLKPGEVIYKCPKCCCIKPERAHHCRYWGAPTQQTVSLGTLPARGDAALGRGLRLCQHPVLQAGSPGESGGGGASSCRQPLSPLLWVRFYVLLTGT